MLQRNPNLNLEKFSHLVFTIKYVIVDVLALGVFLWCVFKLVLRELRQPAPPR